MLLAGSLAMLTGCGPGWIYNYVDAQDHARRVERPLLVFYRDHLDLQSTEIQEILESGPLQPALQPYVLCSLLSAYDPNRKFMAQYGVLAPPALVIIHPDSTYHAMNPEPNPAAIQAFLTESKPPGKRPEVDITIPRGTSYLARAYGSYDKAADVARRQNRKLLIIYKWWLDADSTEMLARMSRPEVSNRTIEAVPCVLDWDYVPNRDIVARFGVNKYPAIIVVNPDGTHASREGLLTVEELARFLSTTMERSTGRTAVAHPRPTAPPPQQQHRPAATTDGWSWSPYYERAREQAQQQSKGMFIFYHSLLEDESARMARLLDTQTVTEMFAGLVHCSMSYAVPRNRQVIATYGVTRSPAFVAVRPDGRYMVREGLINIDDLRSLQRFLRER